MSAESRGTRAARERVANAGRFKTGSDVHLIEMLLFQLDRANRIIGWMSPHIGQMCTPPNGISEWNEHSCENHIPEPGEVKK